MEDIMNLVGRKFNRLTVKREADKRGKHRRYICLCDCGEEVTVYSCNLGRGHSGSCGCLRKENATNAHRTHGHFGSPEYSSWQRMKDRCNNPSNLQYKDYGGRGIVVCSAWDGSFVSFYRDMGKRPDDKTSIGRIDNNLGYFPENCRWENATEQGRNKRTSRIVKIKGTSKVFSEWCQHFNIPASTVRQRLKRGWDMEIAFSYPVRNHKIYNKKS
jgi:hypothetical protein